MGRRGEKCVVGIWPTVWRLAGAVPKMFLTDVKPAMDVVRGATATDMGEDKTVFTCTDVLVFWRGVISIRIGWGVK